MNREWGKLKGSRLTSYEAEILQIRISPGAPAPSIYFALDLLNNYGNLFYCSFASGSYQIRVFTMLQFY